MLNPIQVDGDFSHHHEILGQSEVCSQIAAELQLGLWIFEFVCVSGSCNIIDNRNNKRKRCRSVCPKARHEDAPAGHQSGWCHRSRVALLFDMVGFSTWRFSFKVNCIFDIALSTKGKTCIFVFLRSRESLRPNLKRLHEVINKKSFWATTDSHYLTTYTWLPLVLRACRNAPVWNCIRTHSSI
jgi:hypothetical protein